MMILMLENGSSPKLFPVDFPDLWIVSHLKEHLKQDCTYLRLLSNLESEVHTGSLLYLHFDSSVLDPKKEGEADAYFFSPDELR